MHEVIVLDDLAREGLNLLGQSDVPVHLIGDVKDPRHLMYAISEAEEVGRDL